jgi:hypothetical protein
VDSSDIATAETTRCSQSAGCCAAARWRGSNAIEKKSKLLEYRGGFLQLADLTLELPGPLPLGGLHPGLHVATDEGLLHPAAQRLHPIPTRGPIALHARYAESYSSRWSMSIRTARSR